ncbi:MAG TPA: hypothetical protein VFN31_02415 [Candidatus Saccharimonadales bacterium]|nr:hypothetical protein [Candidatus Saccharimonadales bacterium]
MKINKHIEIVRSSIKSLSSMSIESANAIKDVLVDHYSDVQITDINNMKQVELLIASKPDLVFLGMEYIHRESEDRQGVGKIVWLPDILEQNSIAYTGSRPSCL